MNVYVYVYARVYAYAHVDVNVCAYAYPYAYYMYMYMYMYLYMYMYMNMYGTHDGVCLTLFFNQYFHNICLYITLMIFKNVPFSHLNSFLKLNHVGMPQTRPWLKNGSAYFS